MRKFLILYSSPYILRVVKCEEDETGGAYGMYKEEEKCQRVLVGKYKGKGTLEYIGVRGRMIL
jgi:hypothetical protein